MNGGPRRTRWWSPRWLAGIGMILVLALAAVLNSRSHDPAADDSARNPSPPDPLLVERGRYLALAGNCAGCHTERGGAALAGGGGVATPFGIVYPGNLTPDPQTGLGRWTAAQFWEAMHNGRSRDGRLLYPAFPYPSYTKVTRDDTDAIFAWLRTLPAVSRPNREHALRFPFDTQAALALWRLLFFSPGVFEADSRHSAEWNRGAYLVEGLGHCEACHSPRNALGASRNERLAGGLIPILNWYAPSLISDREAGLADWPIDEIMQLLGTGLAPRGSMIGPMADIVYTSTQHLSPGDLRAIATYLKALASGGARAGADDGLAKVSAPRSGDAAERGALPAFAGSRAEKIYADRCASCHGEDGAGRRADGARAYPALAGNRSVRMDSPANAIQTVLAGGYLPATSGNPRPWGMPPFAHLLDDAEVAAVVSYVRGAWGNAASPVTGLQVEQYREGRGR